ncbi:MAG: hypothetical protein SVK08_01835 [Halobacteriota archaeon]|nr:hypothetical protein [Halobacteriota archaeon]
MRKEDGAFFEALIKRAGEAMDTGDQGESVAIEQNQATPGKKPETGNTIVQELKLAVGKIDSMIASIQQQAPAQPAQPAAPAAPAAASAQAGAEPGTQEIRISVPSAAQVKVAEESADTAYRIACLLSAGASVYEKMGG